MRKIDSQKAQAKHADERDFLAHRQLELEDLMNG